jgi:putative heme-binding domain-containing protein
MKRALLLLALTATALAQTPNVLSLLAQQVAKTSDVATQKNILRGMNAALQGRTNVVAPPEWDALAKQLASSSDGEARELALSIGIVFGTKEALDSLRVTAADTKATAATRQRAIEALVAKKDSGTSPILRGLLAEAGPLRASALRGLASYDAADTADLVLGAYAGLSTEEKRDALATLAARPAWSKALVAALEAEKVPRADFSAPLVRQLRGYKDVTTDAALDKHFGKLSGTTDKQPEIAAVKKWLTADFVKSGNPGKGREVFSRTCATCHKLFDAGNEIGPELTGANRTDIDYLLQNVVDPNALIGADYQLQMFEMKDGRVLAGMVRGENANTLTIRTLTEQTVVAKGDIKTRTISPMSMMPEGQLQAMSKEDVRDLFRYLASPQQVAIP